MKSSISISIIFLKEPLILICYSGAKSKKLADDLCQQGYDAYSIEGGFYSILHQKT